MFKLYKAALTVTFVAGLLLSGSLFTSAFAGNIFNGVIVRVATNTNSTGVVTFTIFVNSNDSNIGCNSGALNAMAIDVSTSGGKAAAAVALAAQTSGQTVTLLGAGNCSVSGNTETAGQVSIP